MRMIPKSSHPLTMPTNLSPIKLNSDLAHVRNWLIENKLHMYRSKSKLMFISSSYSLNNKNTEQPVVVDNLPISRTDKHKCLGLQVDEKLSWAIHINMPNLRNSFVRRNDHHLRNNATDLTLPKSKREFLQRSFKYSGAKLWNQLLNEAKLTQSIYSFSKCIKIGLCSFPCCKLFISYVLRFRQPQIYILGLDKFEIRTTRVH